MKMRIALPLVLTLFCLTLAAPPAMAQSNLLFTTGSHQGPSPVGTSISSPSSAMTSPSASWDCGFHDCDVTGVTFWTFNSQIGNTSPPIAVSWTIGPNAFSSTGGGGGRSDILQLGSCVHGEGATLFCLDSISFGRSVDVPGGTNWLQLFGYSVSGPPGLTNWSNGNFAGMPSMTEIRTKGVVTGYPSPLAFSVFGTATAVPEPGSFLLLGSGILGLAGVVRRKLMR